MLSRVPTSRSDAVRERVLAPSVARAVGGVDGPLQASRLFESNQWLSKCSAVTAVAAAHPQGPSRQRKGSGGLAPRRIDPLPAGSRAATPSRLRRRPGSCQNDEEVNYSLPNLTAAVASNVLLAALAAIFLPSRLVFTATALVVGTGACLAAYFVFQAFLDDDSMHTSVGDPGVLRAVLGGAST